MAPGLGICLHSELCILSVCHVFPQDPFPELLSEEEVSVFVSFSYSCLFLYFLAPSSLPLLLWSEWAFAFQSPGYAIRFLAAFSASLANSAFSSIVVIFLTFFISSFSSTESGISITAIISISRRDDTLPIDLSSPCRYRFVYKFVPYFVLFVRFFRMRLPIFIHPPFESVEKSQQL